MSRHHLSCRSLCRLVGLLVLVPVLAFILDRNFPPVTDIAEADSTEVLAADGERLRLYTTSGGYWRLPADIDDLDPRFVRMLLAYEDQRFYRHPGVDPLALLRALGQLLIQGRVVSGGSTLTMQTVRLLTPRPRTLFAKLQEMLRALQLETRLSKQAILARYLTLAPYGGNIQGVRAASLFYFGKEPGFLTLAESALLVALPQSPERRRPDRHPAEARSARDAVLQRLAAAGVIESEQARRAQAEPVPRARRSTPRAAAHLADRLRAAHSGEQQIVTTLDAGLQRRLEALSAQRQAGLAPGLTLAVLVVDNHTGAVRAYVGSGDYFATGFAGQVDMVRALRSPGSALKPFVYGLGFDAGFIHPETLIADRAGPVAGYAPGNFDHRYHGELTVREALQTSRNIPAIQVMQRVRPGRFVAALARAGIDLRLPPSPGGPGLPVALGGVGIRLQDLTVLFSALAGQGRLRPLHFRADAPVPLSRALLTPVAAWYLTDILQGAPLPTGFLAHSNGIAFKTGTSYGFRDAWAIGYDAAYTVGIWVGRPDGGYTADLSGLASAVPVLLAVFDRLPRAGLQALLNTPPPGVVMAGNSGLPQPLRRFGSMAANYGPVAGDSATPHIVYPPHDSVISLATDAEVIIQATGGEGPFHWLLDGRPVARTGGGRQWVWTAPGEGAARVTIIDSQGRSDAVRFTIHPGGGIVADGP